MLKTLIEKYVAARTPPVSREQIEREVKSRNSAHGKEIAARYTRGNVSIQMGEMTFEDDLGPNGAKPPRGYRILNLR